MVLLYHRMKPETVDSFAVPRLLRFNTNTIQESNMRVIENISNQTIVDTLTVLKILSFKC